MNKNKYIGVLVGFILVLFLITKEVILLNEELFLILAFFIFLFSMIRFVSNPFAKQLDLRSARIKYVIEEFMISRIEILKALKIIYKKIRITISRGVKLASSTHFRIAQNRALRNKFYENPENIKNAFLLYQLNTVLIEEVLLLKDIYKSEIESYVDSCQKHFKSHDTIDKLLKIEVEEDSTHENVQK